MKGAIQNYSAGLRILFIELTFHSRLLKFKAIGHLDSVICESVSKVQTMADGIFSSP